MAAAAPEPYTIEVGTRRQRRERRVAWARHDEHFTLGDVLGCVAQDRRSAFCTECEVLCSISAATPATCGAEAEVPKKLGSSSAGL